MASTLKITVRMWNEARTDIETIEYTHDVSDCVAEGADDEDLLEIANEREGWTKNPRFVDFHCATVEHTNK